MENDAIARDTAATRSREAPGGNGAPASSHVGDGLRLYTQGHVPEALWDFFEAAGDDPADPLNHYLSGMALRTLGLEDEARAEWREVLTLTLHQAVLAQTIGAEAALAPHNQWACRVAQRLLQLQSGGEEQAGRQDEAEKPREGRQGVP